MKKMKKQLKKAFTLIELLMVIIIILTLMSLLMAVNPGSEAAATLARLSRISSAVHTYHDHFQAFPRSWHYNFRGGLPPLFPGSVTGDYTVPDPTTDNNGLDLSYATILTMNGLRRRDLRFIDQMFIIGDDAQELLRDNNDNQDYLIDGWGHKFIYYTGAEIYETTPTNTEHVIARWLQVAGAIPIGLAAAEVEKTQNMHNPNDYFFLISAGEDQVLSFELIIGGGFDPDDYMYQELSPDDLNIDLASLGLDPDFEAYDEMTNYNMRR
jgi:prepilin-type N-terminal cleavage/methylation domain-containing protein